MVKENGKEKPIRVERGIKDEGGHGKWSRREEQGLRGLKKHMEEIRWGVCEIFLFGIMFGSWKVEHMSVF